MASRRILKVTLCRALMFLGTISSKPLGRTHMGTRQIQWQSSRLGRADPYFRRVLFPCSQPLVPEFRS